MASTAARAYLCFGVLAVVLNSALGGDDLLYEAVGLTSAGLILLGTVLHRPTAWRAWVGIALSQLLFAIGDIAFGSGLASPSPADAFYLGGDLLLIVSMGWLVASIGGKRDLGSHLDASLFALVVGVCGWALFASDSMTTGAIATRIVAVSYPVADLILLALLARLVFVRGSRTPSYWLLLCGVGVLFAADAAYVIPETSGAYRAGGWLDAAWLSSYVLFGLAALHPSMGRFREAGPAHGPSLPMRRAFVLGLGLVAVPVAMVVHRVFTTHVNVLADELAMVVITAGVVLRGGVLVWELERLRHKAEQSERKFRLVFERAPIGISIGTHGIMSETNPALQKMLGYTPTEFAQMHYTDVTHPDDQDIKQQLELDASERQHFAIDKRYVRKDGTAIDAHVHVALEVEDGLGISIIEDVTKRHELEDQLRQAQKMEAIGKLAGGIAHDFNNLMTAVMGYSDLLLRDAVDGDRERVEAIRDSAVRASDLTRQLLAFSRRQVLQTQEIDLRDVVERMDTLLKHLIGEDVRLQTLFGADPVIVRADQTQLEQVVMNLTVNARDAMPDGGRLTIETANATIDAAYAARHDEVVPGQYTVVAVSDTGTGMPKQVMEKAFEPFFTTKDVGRGTGLGLSQVYGFVKQSGGHVRLYSELGHGTTVKLYLPRVAGDGAAPAPADVTILLVEDDADVRIYIADMLCEIGYRVVEAEDGAGGLRQVATNRAIRLLFTDLGLPGEIDGRRLAEETRRRRPKLPILFTTGYARDAVMHHGRLDANVELIGKPFTYDALAAKLRHILK
jgi:PAS domain S-box-containing protein